MSWMMWAALGGMGTTTLLLGMLPPRRSLAMARLQAVCQVDEPVDAETLQRPLVERVVQPLLATLGSALLSRTPDKQVQEIRRKLSLVGSSMKAEHLLAVKLVVMAGGGLGMWLVATLTGFGGPAALALPVAGLALGYLLPERNLNTRLRKRRDQVRTDLPTALDILTISMEAGVSLDGAIMRVAGGDDLGPLGQEFRRVVNEIRLGRPRREALLAMAERNDIEELTTCINAIAQAEPLGVSLGAVMRVQSEELRRIQRQRAEEAGAKAPVKMLIPMVGCIFPTIFVVLLGPALLTVTGGQ